MIEVHLLSQSQPIKYMAGIVNTYTKDGFYCILFENKNVHKYPLVNIFRVKELYEFKEEVW